jgi:hypothetical protein
MIDALSERTSTTARRAVTTETGSYVVFNTRARDTCSPCGVEQHYQRTSPTEGDP